LVFPKKSVAKYGFAAVAMVPALLMIPQLAKISATTNVPLIEAIVYFVIPTLIGAAVYFAVLCLIDKETRAIMKFFIEKIQGSL
jgi:hypothetical protein